jgi:hypothetical protein
MVAMDIAGSTVLLKRIDWQVGKEWVKGSGVVNG